MTDNISQELLFLRNLIKVIASPDLSLETKMEESLTMILGKINGGKGSIMLYDKVRNSFKVMASTNKNILNKIIPVDPNTISGYVITTGEPIYLKDIRKSKRFKNPVRCSNYDSFSLICMPLKGKHGNIGVINVSDHLEKVCFTEDDFQLLKDYSYILSPLIENTLLFHEIQKQRDRLEKLSQELSVSREKLKITFEERQELVQMVVHDFKSPLSAVISNLDLLKYVGLNEQQDQFVNTALNGAKKLLDMINEFLQIAKIDDLEEYKEKFTSVSVNLVLDEVLEDLRPQADVKNIDIEVCLEQDINLYGTNSLLLHLFQNLISNAIKYTPENGKIKIFGEVRPTRRVEDEFDKSAVICVEDTGPGIPDNVKKTIFNRFQRLKRDKSIQGTGIGLFICKRIVNILGGKIWVEDATPMGSRFCFTCYVVDGD